MNTDPSDPTVVSPIVVYEVPSVEMLKLSDILWTVSPVSENAKFPKICQKDMVFSYKFVLNTFTMAHQKLAK
jgi:hypothetical protein